MPEEQPIIIIKKPAHHGGHHGGAWKVAFADFMTAMMAFFLVMWILGLSQETRKSIANYFNDPLGAMKSHAGGTKVISTNRESSAGKPSINSAMARILKSDAESMKFKQTKEQIEKSIGSKSELKSLLNKIEIKVTNDGLRIELLEGQEPTFFDSGKAELKGATRKILHDVIAPELKKLPNTISVEGHTDARPFGNEKGTYTNWELSSDRANAARRAMQDLLNPGQITAVHGYADTHLRNLQDPNHFSNRRITILVAYMDKSMIKGELKHGAAGIKQAIGPTPVDLKPNAAKELHPALSGKKVTELSDKAVEKAEHSATQHNTH
jgi:chemotaxis protein MotB